MFRRRTCSSFLCRYGGRYLPVFASAIFDNNALLVKKGMTPVNLTKVLIGNGMTDSYSMMEAYYTYACTTVPFMSGPINTIGSCVTMAKECVVSLVSRVESTSPREKG